MLGSSACRLVTQPIIQGRFLEEGSLRSRSHAGEVRVFSIGRSGANGLFCLPLGPACLFFLLPGALGLLTLAFGESRFSWSRDGNLPGLVSVPIEEEAGTPNPGVPALFSEVGCNLVQDVYQRPPRPPRSPPPPPPVRFSWGLASFTVSVRPSS